MPGHSLRFGLLPLAALLCVGSCLSTEGYYRNDGGAAGTAAAGGSGTAGNGGGGTTGAGGTSGGAAGTGPTTGSAGTGGQAAGTAGSSAGRGGTTGSAGRGGTTGAGGSVPGGTVLLSENFDPQTGIWDFGTSVMHSLMADGAQGQVLSMSEVAGDEALGAAGLGTWTNYSVEAKVKVTALPGTSSSDGVAICARLSGAESYYYFAIQAGDMKGKIKINNGGNSSLSSSFDAGFVMNTWLTMRLDVTGTPATGITLTAYVNGVMRNTYTVPPSESDHLLAMGGMGFMVRKATAQFDDITVRALP
jgi:hypothetical protein